jgi:hypothetical protein
LIVKPTAEITQEITKVLNPITYNNIFDLLCYKISWFIYLCTEVTLAYKKSKSVFPKRWSIAALLASLAYLIAQPPISWGMQIYFQASIDILMVSMPLLHMNMNSYIVHNVIINNIIYNIIIIFISITQLFWRDVFTSTVVVKTYRRLLDWQSRTLIILGSWQAVVFILKILPKKIIKSSCGLSQWS